MTDIPEHLLEYVTEQDYSLYTSIYQATWRYIMRVSKSFFEKTAHPLYLKGLEITGVPIERIPLISEMDAALRKMGWRAVAVNGFIPPAVFLELQSLKILAIACDIRKLENIGYTPSPDIVHEAAGHAPIIADPGYRNFLEAYGEVARNAIINKKDIDLYNAIYDLSEIKEKPASTPELIAEKQKKLDEVSAGMGEPSEVALMARMAWWTTEYGLIARDDENPFDAPYIYGAGLLSSISESFHSFDQNVKKIPFTLESVISTAYDITRPQPQLFVSNSFEELTQALNVFAQGMSYRLGGIHGLMTAKNAETTCTVEMDNGIQYSGILSDFEVSEAGEEVAITLTGPKQLAYDRQTRPEISHHHFGETVYFPFLDKAVGVSTLQDIQRKLHGSGLVTKNGCRIMGRFKREVSIAGRVRLLILENVKIIDQNDKIVFQEKEREYPLAIANQVVSVFGGAADRTEFALRGGNRKCAVKSHQSNLTDENIELNHLYRVVREFRESKMSQVEELDEVIHSLNEEHPHDWLLRLEILELYQKYKPENVMTAKLRNNLLSLKEQSSVMSELIDRGMK